MSNDLNKNLDAMLKDGQHAAVALLTRALPKMQPSALKHSYMNSIINVINHPEAGHTTSDGTRYLIGFGDEKRSLPLVVIQEGSDRTIRHAFPPNEKDPTEKMLLDRLQTEETLWAIDHDTQPRNLARLIRDRGRDQVALYGVNLPDPPPRKPARETISRSRWLPTRPISPEHELAGSLSPDTTPGSDDMWSLTRNVETSATMVGNRLGPSSLEAHLKADPKKKTLRLDDLTYYGPEEDEPELG